ncbi:MAG TPA: hypothetical protein DCX53_03995, partial [Anaerolineae bacterium]|nr:hypothetical protein [Anaerolineae bacterium]
LALANSFATALEATALFIFMRRRLNGIAGKQIVRGFIQASTATLAMIVVLFFWFNFKAVIPPWIFVLGGITVGGSVYLLAAVILGVPEIRLLTQSIQRRIQRT